MGMLELRISWCYISMCTLSVHFMRCFLRLLRTCHYLHTHTQLLYYFYSITWWLKSLSMLISTEWWIWGPYFLTLIDCFHSSHLPHPTPKELFFRFMLHEKVCLDSEMTGARSHSKCAYIESTWRLRTGIRWPRDNTGLHSRHSWRSVEIRNAATPKASITRPAGEVGRTLASLRQPLAASCDFSWIQN